MIYKHLTREQNNVSMRNRNKRWKEICGSIRGIKGYVLHHNDTTLLYTNPERYILWLPEDLRIMTKSAHLSLHHTGLKYSDETKEKMRQRKLGVPKAALHRQHLSESHKLYWARRRTEQQVRRGRMNLVALKRHSA